MTQRIQLELGNRSYEISIGHGLLEDKDLIRSQIKGPSALIVTNDTVGPLYLHKVEAALSDLSLHVVTLPDGEAYKTLEQFSRIMDELVASGFGRDTTVTALGGGVVGDISGFAAASYQRGVDFLQLPTTLLAQVDSSVGGKTAVNHPNGKNLIGAFHQPCGVIADTQVLSTLEEREFKAGLAEVIKYGVALDQSFLHWIENNLESLLAHDPQALAHAIKRSCELKAGIVEEDERETGPRALLNLGHTFGHAIEATAGYGEWLHGEAVAAGTLMATELSYQQGWLEESQYQRVLTLNKKAGLPAAPPKVDKSAFVAAMGLDKKNRGGRLRLVLLKDIGTAFITETFDQSLLDALLDKHLTDA